MLLVVADISKAVLYSDAGFGVRVDHLHAQVVELLLLLILLLLCDAARILQVREPLPI